MKFQTPAEFSEWMRKKAYDAVIATSNLPWYSPTEKKNGNSQFNTVACLCKVQKNGQKKSVTYFATLLHNELNSNVACFTTHAKKPCNLICCKTRLLWGLKRATSLFSSFCSHTAKQVHVARVLLPILLWLKDLKRRALQIVSL